MSYGQFNAGTDQDEFNSISFLIDQAIMLLQTITLVKVVSVHGAGVGPTGTVDVQPLVNQMVAGPNGTRTAVPHGTIYDIPFFRLQGGNSAFICDPVVGDIGKCAFASRDISSVKANKDVANPGSLRVYDWSDGLYLGGYINGTPTQYIQMLAGAAGILIHASATEISGTLKVDGTTHLVGDVTADGAIHAATLHAANGFTGTFATGDSRTVTVVNGIITGVA